MGSPDIRSRWRALSKKERRFLLLLAFCLLAGVVLMGLDGSQERSEPTESLTVPVPDEVVSDGNEELEQKLEALLSQVKGAGRVQVAVTYADSAASIYAYDNSTRTTAGEGTTSQDTESSLVSINNQPVLVSTASPKIQGVVAVAEGGGDPLVQGRLYQALRSLLGINASQIAIIEAEGSEQDYEDR